MSSTDTAQPAAIDRLRRSLAHGRLAHAYLFAGPRGSGKSDAARWLAQILNCERGRESAAAHDDGCGSCDACRRVAGDAHPDVYWVRPESKSRRITVEQVRQFEDSIQLRAAAGGIKLGILVDADCLNDQAANAFLKTLEEPPPRTVILLLSTEPQRLLPTVLSRCARLNFGAGAAVAAAPYRERVLALLQDDRLRDARAGRVVASYGLLAALTALLNEIRGEIEKRSEETAAAQIEYAELDAKVKERLIEQQKAQIEGEYRAAREQIMETFYAWHADILLCTQGVDDALLTYPASSAQLRQAAEKLDYRRALANLEAVEKMRDGLARSVSEPLALEVGLLRLA